VSSGLVAASVPSAAPTSKPSGTSAGQKAVNERPVVTPHGRAI
jgi:hypothetical protein